MHRINASSGRPWRGGFASAFIFGLLASSVVVAQTTVGVGTTLPVTSDTLFSVTNLSLGPLVMDGGTMRISDGATGQALTVTMLDAALKRGSLYNPYNQTGVSVLIFNGTTSVSGGLIEPYPADGMYIRASSFDSNGFQVFNNGTFVQTANGNLTTQGPVQFNNLGTFDIKNDLGFAAGEFSGFKAFFNTGVFQKTAGTGTSVVHAMFHQDGGSVQAHVGSLLFAAGGYHKDASFAANPLGTNPTGQIALEGAHTFAGTVITHSGGLIGLSPGATLDVPEIWDQRGTFSNAADIRISESGILANSGLFLPSGGKISGSAGLVAGVVLNAATGFFSSDIAPTYDAFGQEVGRLNVVNRGSITVATAQNVLVKNFVNESGTVIVNGLVENMGGTFQLLGGVLSGNGTINGDTFVGSLPGPATFKPGSSPGTMTINGALSLLPGGILELEVERDVPTGAILYDQVIAQSFFLDGQISFLIGEGVTEADVLGLQFLDCGGASSVQYGGNFSYNFAGRPGSSLSFDSNGIYISALTPVPEPGTVAVILAGMGLLGVAGRRRTRCIRMARVQARR